MQPRRRTGFVVSFSASMGLPGAREVRPVELERLFDDAARKRVHLSFNHRRSVPRLPSFRIHCSVVLQYAPWEFRILVGEHVEIHRRASGRSGIFLLRNFSVSRRIADNSNQVVPESRKLLLSPAPGRAESVRGNFCSIHLPRLLHGCPLQSGDSFLK
jgi:hypothetical protein